MRRHAGFAADLEALRSEGLPFGRFAMLHAERFRRWARHYWARWPQRFLDVEDLTQEALLEAWRAVDEFDPERGTALDRFVEYRVGRKLRVELERVLGWPKKSRGTTAPKFYSILESDEPSAPPAVLDRLHLEQVAASFDDDLSREVVAGVGLGLPLRAIAARIWDDPDKRIRYRLDDSDHAVRRVRSVVRRAATELRG